MDWKNTLDEKRGKLYERLSILLSGLSTRMWLSLLILFAVLTGPLTPIAFAIKVSEAKRAETRPAKAAPRTQSGDTVTFYGPRRFDRLPGPPVTVSDQFTIPFGIVAPYTIQVQNGAPDGTHRVSSATIHLNGVELFTQNAIKDSTPTLSQTVSLQTLNVLQVKLSSAVGSYLTISFTGIRPILPPATLLSVSPTRATQGQTLSVTLQGQNTHWLQGQTRASFGQEVSVGGAAAGELGPVTVTGLTTATAQVTVSSTAALSPRTVKVVTPNVQAPFPLNFIEETSTLVDAFTVVATSPPSPSSTNVTTIAGLAGDPGFADGAAPQARFQSPAGVAVGPDDSIFVADAGNNRIRAVRFEPDQSGVPQWVVSTVAGNGTYGFADGPAATAQFKNPQGVAVDIGGVVFVADTSNNRIRRIGTDGTVTTVAGDGTAGLQDGNATQARFNAPRGLAVDQQGNIYVADTGNAAVRLINSSGQVSTLAGDGTIGSNDSPPARFDCPSGVAVSGSTVYVYLADKGNHRIRRLDSTGTVITIAGLVRGFADGSPSAARFAEPSGIAFDGSGKILVTDAINSLVRQVDPTLAANGSAGAVTTLAGSGERGQADGPGSTAAFLTPRGIASTASSAIIVADTGNHTLRRLRLPPVVSSIAPASARPAETVTINGERFDARGPERNIVRFTRATELGGGQTAATVISASQTSLVVVVPDDAATGAVTVQTEGGTAVSPTPFEVLPPIPVITGFTPQAGAVGATVTLTGEWLKAHTGDPTVTFTGRGNTRLPALVTFASRTQVNVTIPNAALTGPIQLTNAWGQTSTSQPFTVNASHDFQLTVAPSTATAVQGTSATYLAQLTSTHATFTQLARLSVTGLPAGVEVSLGPSQIAAGSSATIGLSLANANLAPGSYPFTIRAAADIDGNEAVRTVQANLSVVATGQTTLSGRVMSTENEPIIGATISLDGHSATTDAAGSFLLSGINAGPDRPVMIDGRTASAPNRTYPVLAEPATIVAGQANAVPYVFYLPPIDVENEIVLVPGQTTVITTPRVPGLQLTVPAGANLRNRDNTPVTRVSITPVPIDRTPTPLPPNVTTAMVYTNQPGGAISDIPMPMVFPNLSGADPGTLADLYAFNHDTVEWYVYGYGRVSADGRLIVPEINPATGQPYGLVDFSWYFPSVAPNGNPGDRRPCPTNRTGDPVDLSTGTKIETMTDISFGGARGGIKLTRVFTSDLNAGGANFTPILGRFGRGTKDSYDIRLTGTFGIGGAGRVVMPEERTGRLFSYRSTDPDGALIFDSTGTISQLGDVVRQLANGTFEYRYARGEVLRFDSSRRLVAMVDRNENTTTFSYTGSNLTMVTDPVGRSITLAYNSDGFVERVTDPLGRRWLYTYSFAAFAPQLATVTDPLDNVVRYAYAEGPLVSITDGRENLVKQLAYDSNGRLFQQTFADGGFERYTYQLSGTAVTGVSVTDSLGRTERKRFNFAGYVIGMTDALGQISLINRDISTNLGISVVGTCGCPEAVSNFDVRGNMLATINQLGHTASWEYEPQFNRVVRSTDQLGRVTSFTYDGQGNTTSATNARNQTVSFTYNSYGELTSIAGPLSHTTTIEYDAAGNMTEVTDALGNHSVYEYDGVGRLTRATDPLGRHESYTYDTLDRIVSATDSSGGVTTYTYDANGNMTSLTDALSQEWTAVHDENNRPILTVDPLERVMEMVYNTKGQILSMSSPLGRTKSYTYDARGQLATVTDPLGGVVRIAYDNKGKPASLIDQRGGTSTYTYDELSRLVGVRDPLGRFSTMSYDATGNVVESIDRLGRRTTVSYDELDRPMTLTRPDAVINYAYDVLGRPTRIDDSQSGSIEWTYDGGRLLSETTPAGVVTYTYNAAGQVLSMTAANELPVTYSYDSAGRLQGITQGTETFTYGYDTLSRLSSLQRPNGVASAYSYDPINRLKRMTHTNGLNQAIEDYRYTYTLDSQISSITSLAPGHLLPSAKNAAAADAVNRISQFGSTTYGFDPEGQTTTRTDTQGTTDLHWDTRGRLRQVVLPGGQSVNYGYDALGRLASRTQDGATTSFLNDGDDVVLDRKSDGSTSSYLNGVGLDHKLRQTSTSTGPLYFLQDHLGSTRLFTEANGNVVEQLLYEPYGEGSGSALTRYGYTGRERDSTSGLHYYRARWYDAQQGRFLSEDTAGFLGGLNLYAYVTNDPINSNDPQGLYEIDVHYYLTYYLLSKSKCLTQTEANWIANANQGTDENPDTAPGPGSLREALALHDDWLMGGNKGMVQAMKNAVYHGLDPRGPEFLETLRTNSQLGRSGDLTAFGVYLHHLQDSFSHAGYPNPAYGHLFSPLHKTDKTKTNVEKAREMVRKTWDAINEWTWKTRCCVTPFDPSWWNQINPFLEASGGPARREINADELNRKRQILGLEPRWGPPRWLVTPRF